MSSKSSNCFAEFITSNFYQAQTYWYCYCTITCMSANQVVGYMQGYLSYGSCDDGNVPASCEGSLKVYYSDYQLNIGTLSELEKDSYSLTKFYLEPLFCLQKQGETELIACLNWTTPQQINHDILSGDAWKCSETKDINQIQIVGYRSGVLYGFGQLKALNTDNSEDEVMYLISIGKPQPLNRDIYQQQRRPRFGNDNPEKMEYEFWKYMIKTGDSPYAARVKFRETENTWFNDAPMWSFQRFGVSRINLYDFEPDNRIIFIGGEHEDYYDPDFYIYNDVIEVFPDGEINIYGYPKELFPPTDFHSATLIDQCHICIIGCLGYPEDRKYGYTPVYLLNYETFNMEPVETTGENPGWIYDHKAELLAKKNCIKLEKGKILELEADKEVSRDNTDVYYLNLLTWEWSRGTMK